jgi:hypothetical protein
MAEVKKTNQEASARIEAGRKPYNSPELKDLGAIQSLVRSSNPTFGADGDPLLDGTSS